MLNVLTGNSLARAGMVREGGGMVAGGKRRGSGQGAGTVSGWGISVFGSWLQRLNLISLS